MPLEIGAYRRILNPLVSNPRWRPRRHRRLRSASPRSASRCPCSRTTFDPVALRERAGALEARMGESGFWDDPEAAAKVNAEYARVQRRLETYDGLEADVADLDGLLELAEEDPELEAELDETLRSVEQRLETLEGERLFTGTYDAGDALVTVNAGAGGRGGRRDRDRRGRPAGRHLPRVGRRRPARQQDRLGGADHAQAERDRRAVPERALAVVQPCDRDGDAAGQARR